MTLTCSGLKFCSPDDAKLVIHAARKGYLPFTTQRLSQAERSEIRPGDVYVWFGRGADALTGTPALERWTDGHSWGPSRMKDEYLYYHEKRAGEVTPVSTGHSARFVSSDPTHFESPSPSRSGAVSDPRPPPHPDNGPADPNQLIKQTYSVICDPRSQNPTHWRLTTYFTLSSLPKLHTVRSGYIPCLASLTFPSDQYKWFKAYKAELRHDVERATDAVQVPRRGSFESQHDASSPGRQSLPSLTTIAPPRHSPTPSSPSLSRTPTSPYMNYMPSHQHQSPSAPSSRSTPLLPLAELQNAHPRGQRSDLDQRQLAALSSSRPASVAPMSPSQTWATPFSYTNSYPNQQYTSFAYPAAHTTQCSVCASLGTSMSMCSRCGNWIGQ